MRKNSIKNTRINGEVQKELSRIISREIKDPRISPMTSVVAVEVAPDLKQCKATSACWAIKMHRMQHWQGLKVPLVLSAVSLHGL